MPFVALLCAGLFGLAGPDSPPDDFAAEYHKLKASSGRTPADEVRLALWCEQHGLDAERARHLTLALLGDPAHATARGLLGLVARDNRWRDVDAVAAAARADAPRQALLADYNERRAATPDNAPAQWTLGLWAEEQGLSDQAKAHFTAVVRLDPANQNAWIRLGFQKVAGRWSTHEQVAAIATEAAAQRKADRAWTTKLERWKKLLADPATAEHARTYLLGVTDPRAVRSIEAVFGDGTEAHELVAVGLLGQIDGAPASLRLASLAVGSRSPRVRQVAAETLVPRDARDFVASLTRLVQTPYRYEVRAVTGPRSAGELFVEGERFNVRRIYNPPPIGPLRPADRAAADVPEERSAVATQRLTAMASAAARWAGTPTSRAPETEPGDGQFARRRLIEDVRTIETANSAIRANNDRILPILTRITQQTLGEDHAAWERWQTDEAGYAFQGLTSEKPTVTEIDQLTQLFYASTPRRGDCFAAGTPVRTIDGTRPIDQLQRGDIVLTQDTVSGALSYQAILTAFRTPPAPTVRVAVGPEMIVATGIHRFWRAGKGWTMARNLRPGDSLRILGGLATVAAVTAEPSQPMFNLEVAHGRSFFVGQVGALVHDNTPIETTPEPFDAPRLALAPANPADR